MEVFWTLLVGEAVLISVYVAKACTGSFGSGVARSGTVIDAKLSTVHDLLLEEVLGLLSALDVDKVGMREASWLTAAAIDGNTNVEHVLDLSEQVCHCTSVFESSHCSVLSSHTIQIAVAHLV